MVRVQQEADSVERSLKERAQKLELVRCELEDEISRLKAAALQDRLQAEETLMFTKQKIKTEEVRSFVSSYYTGTLTHSYL